MAMTSGSGRARETRQVRFNTSGTWAVPAGVYWANAYGTGGGGGVSGTLSTVGVAGSDSTVAFTGGTVTLPGRPGVTSPGSSYQASGRPGVDGTGTSATANGGTNRAGYTLTRGTIELVFFEGGATVTPGASIAVTVGAGGVSTANGGSGFVIIEYEV
jgi:hypothetical protein